VVKLKEAIHEYKNVLIVGVRRHCDNATAAVLPARSCVRGLHLSPPRGLVPGNPKCLRGGLIAMCVLLCGALCVVSSSFLSSFLLCSLF
jgi:hypothetical protein